MSRCPLPGVGTRRSNCARRKHTLNAGMVLQLAAHLAAPAWQPFSSSAPVERNKKSPAARRPSGMRPAAAMTASGTVTISIAFSWTWYPSMKLHSVQYRTATGKARGSGRRLRAQGRGVGAHVCGLVGCGQLHASQWRRLACGFL